ncbi:MAG: calcium-binding protein, partial [Glaciihabitans sp.]|nr:calcium-binding protein [Glaciihabitans sp.]
MPENSVPPRRTLLPRSTWVVGGLLVLLLVLCWFTSALPQFFVALSATVLLTGLYVLVTGRRSWAVLRGRKNGGIAVIASMALLIGGASWGVAAAGPSVTPAPTAAFTD